MSLKIGMIGTGWFAGMHAKLLKDRTDVVVSAIVGSSYEKAKRFADSFTEAKAYDTVSSMLDDQKLDAVYICTPPFAHGEFEEALIDRGIPFLVEKPLAVDSELPAQILQKIKQKAIITSVGYHFRYMDSADHAKLLLQDRNIALSLGYWMGGAPGGTWWRRQERSGGQFVEQTTHIVDLLRYLVGEVKEVYAAYSSGILSAQDEKANVADVGTVTLKLSNGSVATISNACILPTGEHSGLHIYTDKGKMELTHGSLKDMIAGRTTEYLNHSNPYEREMNAFLYAVQSGDTSRIRSSYEDSYQTQLITTAANESARLGKAIVL